MKKFAVIVWAILTFVPSVAQAQIRDDFQATAPKTKLETALRNRDGFMVKDLYRLGTVAGNGLWKQQVIVDALVFHAPGPDSKSIKGIRILLIDNTSRAWPRTLILTRLRTCARQLSVWWLFRTNNRK